MRYHYEEFRACYGIFSANYIPVRKMVLGGQNSKVQHYISQIVGVLHVQMVSFIVLDYYCVFHNFDEYSFTNVQLFKCRWFLLLCISQF
ncbi:hypothetical protein RchiOBHm_Chr7g0234321 [Rosa chinensis]|uniref:Uncharacterized protein n=1 Tax=Rosa chinensis TaxID=74649 RepID=A0A2P6PGF2_ROSCH|nr:hypothetical protein RchiOBHm_Chr7g0234321 [Rosa chinensis]